MDCVKEDKVNIKELIAGRTKKQNKQPTPAQTGTRQKKLSLIDKQHSDYNCLEISRKLFEVL